MPNLSQILGDDRTTELDLGGGAVLTVTYDRTLVTADIDQQKSEREAAETICAIVSAWDLTGPVPTRDNPRTGKQRGELVPDGQPVPLDPEVIQHLPIGVLTGMLQTLSIDTVASLDPTKQVSRSRPGPKTPTSQP